MPGRALAPHGSAEQPATHWRLTPSLTTQDVDLFYLLYNPSDSDADVTVTYRSADGAELLTKTYRVLAHGRVTIAVDNENPALADASVAAEVASPEAPVVVEQSMFVTEDGRPRLALSAMGIAEARELTDQQ